MPSYYETLSIETKVSKTDLIVAYFARASNVHPAHASSNDNARDFLVYSEAFAVLYDAKSRFRYDAFLKSGSLESFHIQMDTQTALALYDEMAGQIAASYADEGMNGDEILECLSQFKCPNEIAVKVVSVSITAVQIRANRNQFWRIVRTFLFAVITSLLSLLAVARIRSSNPLLILVIAGCLVCVATVIYYLRGAPLLDDSIDAHTLGMKQLKDFNNNDEPSFKNRR
jgi:hypothetical protein